jgi:multiple antibiotic resistance protein
MDGSATGFLTAMLFTIAALIPITNPPGNAPIFLSYTRSFEEGERNAMARRVAMNCFVMLTLAAFTGIYVLEYFGISLPVVRVAGGLLVAATAWRLLNAEEGEGSDAPSAAPNKLTAAQAAGRAFYPLSFPITVGPGSIATAITLGVALPSRGVQLLSSAAGMVVGITLVSLAIYLADRYASKLVRILGETGTAVFLRLSAFILLCIGVQICWDGVSELLAPWKLR